MCGIHIGLSKRANKEKWLKSLITRSQCLTRECGFSHTKSYNWKILFFQKLFTTMWNFIPEKTPITMYIMWCLLWHILHWNDNLTLVNGTMGVVSSLWSERLQPNHQIRLLSVGYVGLPGLPIEWATQLLEESEFSSWQWWFCQMELGPVDYKSFNCAITCLNPVRNKISVLT
jgi:hypothetical protein